MQNAPSSCDIDLFTREAIADPYPLYRPIRDAGAAVWMTRHDVWAVGRYADLRDVLRNHDDFSSASGVGMDAKVNEATSGTGNSLTSDPPLHEKIRRITSAPLVPRALKDIEATLTRAAEDLIDDLVVKGSFDGMRDLAQHLPLAIVSKLVGLPEYGRDSMLNWATANFNALGPMNDLGAGALPLLRDFHKFCTEEAIPGKLRPDGWAQKIYDAAERGEVPRAQCPAMMREYIGPSLDTTIFATGHLIRLLGQHPDQWALLKREPGLIPGAINEALRLYSPIRSFTRRAVKDTQIGEAPIARGDRILLLYACANRDERKWTTPDAFDIRRSNQDHIAFGHGIHTCSGMHLARMEMTALLQAMISRVASIQVGEPVVEFNNLLSGFASLPVRFAGARREAPASATVN